MKKILLALSLFFTQALIINAQEYLWPINNSNMEETYIEYGYERRTYDTTAYDKKYNYEPKEKTFGTLSKCSGKTTCNENHYGVDITGIKGNTYEIVSVSNGTVIATSKDRFFYAGTNLKDRNQRNSSKDGGGYGNYVVIQDNETGICFLYAHMKAGTINVTKGENVFAGQIIGVMGSSGDSGHMHLHFEVRPNLNALTTNFGGSLTVTTGFNKETTDPTKYIGNVPTKQEPKVEEPKEEPVEEPIYVPEEPTYEPVIDTPAKLISIEQDNNKIYVSFDKEITVNKEPTLEVTIGYYIRKAKYIGTNEEKTKLIYTIDYNEFDVEASGNIYGTSYDGDITYKGNKVNTASSVIIGKMNPYKITNVKSYIKNGDVNEDGSINAKDANIVLKLVPKASNLGYNALTEEEKGQYDRADMNNDGVVNSKDASDILKYAAKVGTGLVESNIQNCDLNKDNTIDELDISLLRQAISNNSTSKIYDINNDDKVNDEDLKELKNTLLKFGSR